MRAETHVLTRLTLVAASLSAVLSCTDSTTAPQRPITTPSQPKFAISDGRHSPGGSHFFFLPPTVIPQPFPPPPFTGTFDGTITSAARVCQGTGPCSPTAAIAVFTPAGGTGGSPLARLQVSNRLQAYGAIWDTRQCASGPCTLDPSQAYRLHVYATNAVGAEVELGFADITVLVPRRHQPPPSVDLSNYSPLVQNLPYIIAFRIEQGVVGSVTVSPATNALKVGATQQLTAAVTDLHGVTLTGRVVTWASSNTAVATVDGNGVVTAVAPGTATITATSEFQSGSATVTVTPAGKPLYVANGNNSILVYAAGASGNVAPTATIAGSNTGLNNPWGVALDASGQLYVGNNNSNSITIYAAGASGNVTPTATIAGSNTGLNGPTFMTFSR